MPLDVAEHTKRAGDSLTASNELALRQDVENVIGVGGASQGVTAADIRGPIPNEFFDYTGNLVALTMDVYIASGSALGCPPTTLPMPFAGTLLYIVAQTTIGTPHTIVIAKAGKVVHVEPFAPASSDRPYVFTVASDATFDVGDMITVANVESSHTAPVVGDDLAEEAFDCQASYELWFVPDEEE